MPRKDWPNKRQKLEELAEEHDCTVSEFLAERNFSATTVPGICMRQGCRFIEEYEPDQTEGWCPECGTNSVCSVLVLAGFI